MTPDRWLEVRIRHGTLPADVLVEALLALGGRAVYEDDGWHVTHLPDPGSPRDVQDSIRRLRGEFSPEAARELEVETRWQAQEDWERFWRRGLEPRRVTPRLLVTPSWTEVDAGPGDLVITVDPGMAFGNAEHGTTRGCLRILDAQVSAGERLLDVGAGSGILSIAAALLGARSVRAVEADPLAIPTARENVARNGVSDRVSVEERRVDAADLRAVGSFDGVMANLETGFLRPLLPGLVAATRPGGWLLLSGILRSEWEDLRRQAEDEGVVFRRLDEDGEWCSGLFHRPPG